MLLRSFTAARLYRLRPFAHGLLCGALCWVWMTQFFLTWGVTHETVCALAATFGLATLGSLVTWTRPGRETARWLWLGLAAWALFAPTALESSMSLAGRIAGPSLADSRIVFGSALAAGLAALAPGLLMTFRLAGSGREDSRGRSSFWIGAAATWLLLPHLNVSWITLQTVAVLSAVGCTIAFCRAMFGKTSPDPVARPAEEAADEGASRLDWPRVAALAGITFAAGAAMTLTERLIGSLFLPVAPIGFATWAGFALGIAGGLRSRPADSARVLTSRSLMVLGVTLFLQIAALSLLLRAALLISSSVSNLMLIFGLRALIVATLAAPIGWTCGWCLRRPSSRAGVHSRWSPIVVATGFPVGLIVLRWSTLDMTSAGLLASGLLLTSAMLNLRPLSGLEFRSVRHMAAPVAAVLAAVASLFLTPSPDSLRVLFSGRHFQAFHAGTPLNALPHVDEARLVQSVQSPDARWTVWSSGGTHWRILEDGVVRGGVSIDPELSPQVTTDVLTAVLPLAMHPSPRRVLVLGVEAPAVIATCLRHPVEQISAVHADPAAITISRESVRRLWPEIEQGDDRLSWTAIDPLHAIAAEEDLFNLILAPQSSVAEFSAASRQTVEHFRRVAARLTPDGLFCQRLNCFDLGSDSVVQCAATLQAAFPYVQLLEINPGECLFVASLSPVTIDDEMVDRLEKRHVRDLLAMAGWDWSIAMSIRSVSAERLAELTAGIAPHAMRSSRFAVSIPADVMRWGAKYEDRGRWLAKFAYPLADSLSASLAVTEIRDRLSDVQLAQQVITDHPDQYWAYRKWLKKRLTDRPRARVIQTASDGLKNGLHPEDSRRKEYLVVLGRTAATGAPRADLEALAAYATPFDPMVTPFIDREMSVLEARSQEPDPAAAWRACMRSVNFAPASDMSVRNACDAITLLVNHPEVVSDAAERWDHLNGLAELLKQRWLARRQAGANLRYGVADAEATLTTVDDLLNAMDQLRSQVPVSKVSWEIRRNALDRELVRPLRSWRSNQSARHAAAGSLAPPAEPSERLVDQADAESLAPADEAPRALTPEQTAAEPLTPID